MKSMVAFLPIRNAANRNSAKVHHFTQGEPDPNYMSRPGKDKRHYNEANIQSLCLKEKISMKEVFQTFLR